MKQGQFKPVKFPTRRRSARTVLSDVCEYIWEHEAIFAAALIVGLFAIIGAGYSLASLLDHVTAAWGL